MPEPLDVAVVGMAVLFPGAPDLSTYWRNIRSCVDAIQEVPAGRWSPAFYDPSASSIDRFYCKRGGFIDAFASFDALGFGVMPVAARGAEPDQLLTLQVASRALSDAGYDARSFARDRAGVILGRGNYAGAGRTRLEQHVRAAEQLAVSLRDLVPGISEEDVARVKAEFQAKVNAGGADGAIGLVPNLTASRVAHHLDLAGPAFTLDAACASSLVAIDQACRELVSERMDLMLAGGVHLCHDEAFWSVFCQLGALSRTERIRPFDRRADGLLIGEGIGVVVLKRRLDAERDDDRIYAVIRGSGVSSDGHVASLMAPAVSGQTRALERAWKEAGVDPGSLELLEAHGTATPTGDAAELETIERFFGGATTGARAGLGSVKSMIGHTMPAAGVAGFIKAVLALSERVLPPTLHCEEPHPAVERTRFRIVTREEPWERAGHPRRAGVNAFGFGGVNAHLVLEEHAPSTRHAVHRTKARSDDPTIALFAAATKDALLAELRRGPRHGNLEGSARLAVRDPNGERMARAATIVERGRPWRGRDGIWFTPAGLLREGGKIALLFPGVDASFEPRVDDVAERFGLPVPPHTTAKGIEEIGLGIVGVNRLLHRVLVELGVEGDCFAGHSIGEWSAMIATGMIPEPAVDAFVATLRPGTLEVPGVVFGAAGCSVEVARAAMAGLAEIDISHDNCPHQVLFCGREEAVDTALARLRSDGVLCQKLPFQSGFHSRLFEGFLEPHRNNLATLPIATPRRPLWSATTCAPYPGDPDAVRRLAVDHLVQPVRFRELVQALHGFGARVFIQVGTGSLVHFVEDTLRGLPHAAASSNVKDQTGLEQLRRLLALLFVEGCDVRIDALFRPAEAIAKDPIPLQLGVPLVRLSSPLAISDERPIPSPESPLAAEFAAGMDAVARAHSQVLAAFARASAQGGPQNGALEATTSRLLSVDTLPELRDHTFFRQPSGWPNLADLHPVVPMTTSIELMKEAAEQLVPGRKVVSVEGVRAYRWIVVSQPLTAELRACFDGVDRVAVSIEGYAEATCVLADDYPSPPAADTRALREARPEPITAEQLYTDRWMFHGPAFYGVADLGVMGPEGIRGELVTPPALGGLLDSAGQLFGYWVMRSFAENRLAMPVKIDQVRFFGPHPRTGERLTCTVRIRDHGPTQVVADLSLDRNGIAWATIEGWEDRRFETDERLWGVMMFPERNLLAEPVTEGFVVFADRYRAAPTRDQLARRFLGEAERVEYAAQGPRKQRAWLAGRIAAKDAVRSLLWQAGHGPLFPVEIAIESDPEGRPRVHAPSTRAIHVSLAHKDDVAVAIASLERPVGIDVERVEARSDGFAALSFHDDEIRLASEGTSRDEALTRLWVAKEAAAKALGTGLAGDPRSVRVTDRAGDRLLAAGHWVTLRRRGDYVIGWTLP